jgi:hypothetical protein
MINDTTAHGYPRPPPVALPLNAPGSWAFFLSHAQRDGEAKTIAGEIFFGLKAIGFDCWLDVKMNMCEVGT